MSSPQILISAGEPSGEMYAARLAAALHRRTRARLFGLGGVHMRAAGCELLADCSQVSVVGISEVIRRLPEVWRIYRLLADEAARRRPALAILVDFPDFNLRLARRLHAQGTRVVYFISPQVWAWRPQRVQLIKRLVERVLCIFPFEEDFYRRAGIPVDYVGHPLVDTVEPRSTRAGFAAQFGFHSAQPIVGLLPGSRPSEVAHNLPVILDACRILWDRGVRQLALAVAPNIGEKHFAHFARSDFPVTLVPHGAYDVLAHADCSIVSSGTATVEAALLDAPMVVVYRVSGATAFVARRLVRTPFFAMVNLIAGRPVVPELIQEDFTAEAVAREVARLLDSDAARAALRAGLADVRARLGAPGAIDRAAQIIAALIEPGADRGASP
jgi:lipid-A-disaccharide synthase